MPTISRYTTLTRHDAKMRRIHGQMLAWSDGTMVPPKLWSFSWPNWGWNPHDTTMTATNVQPMSWFRTWNQELWKALDILVLTIWPSRNWGRGILNKILQYLTMGRSPWPYDLSTVAASPCLQASLQCPEVRQTRSSRVTQSGDQNMAPSPESRVGVP